MATNSCGVDTCSFGANVSFVDTSCSLTYFTNYTETGQFYPFAIGAFASCLDIQDGDEIGLFDVEQDLLVGADVYCLDSMPFIINAWKGDPQHSLPGYIPGNTLKVVVYDKSASQEMIAATHGTCLQFEECSYGRLDSLGCGIEFCNPIPSGRWALISFPVDPLTDSAGNDITCDAPIVFSGLPTLDIVKDDHGGILIPSQNVNTLGCLDYREAYDVFIWPPDDTLCVTGQEIIADSALIQANRWNNVGYPLLVELPIELILASVISCIDIVKDDNGNVFIPSSNVNSIGNAIPGKGYKIFLSCSTDKWLHYQPLPDSNYTVAGSDGVIASAKSYGGESRHYDYSVTGLSYTLVLNKADMACEAGDEIAVFDGDLCVGAVRYEEGEKILLPAWRGDKEHQLAGYTPGNSVEIRIRQASGDERTVVSASSGGYHFDDAPYQEVDLAKLGALPTEYALSQNYPNPFNPSTTISFALPRAGQVSLEIFNIVGRKVVTLVDGRFEAGSHTVQWDGRSSSSGSVASGIYFYRLQSEGFISSRKMVMLK